MLISVIVSYGIPWTSGCGGSDNGTASNEMIEEEGEAIALDNFNIEDVEGNLDGKLMKVSGGKNFYLKVNQDGIESYLTDDALVLRFKEGAIVAKNSKKKNLCQKAGGLIFRLMAYADGVKKNTPYTVLNNSFFFPKSKNYCVLNLKIPFDLELSGLGTNSILLVKSFKLQISLNDPAMKRISSIISFDTPIDKIKAKSESTIFDDYQYSLDLPFDKDSAANSNSANNIKFTVKYKEVLEAFKGFTDSSDVKDVFGSGKMPDFENMAVGAVVSDEYGNEKVVKIPFKIYSDGINLASGINSFYIADQDYYLTNYKQWMVDENGEIKKEVLWTNAKINKINKDTVPTAKKGIRITYDAPAGFVADSGKGEGFSINFNTPYFDYKKPPYTPVGDCSIYLSEEAGYKEYESLILYVHTPWQFKDTDTVPYIVEFEASSKNCNDRFGLVGVFSDWNNSGSKFPSGHWLGDVSLNFEGNHRYQNILMADHSDIKSLSMYFHIDGCVNANIKQYRITKYEPNIVIPLSDIPQNIKKFRIFFNPAGKIDFSSLPKLPSDNSIDIDNDKKFENPRWTSDKTYQVTTTSKTIGKIFVVNHRVNAQKDSIIPSKIHESIDVKLANNEIKNLQLYINPLEDLKDVDLYLSGPFINDHGDDLDVKLLHKYYVATSEKVGTNTSANLPIGINKKNFILLSGTSSGLSLMLQANITSNPTPSRIGGKYKGSVVLEANNQNITLPISIYLNDYKFPDKPELKAVFQDCATWNQQNSWYGYSKGELNQELMPYLHSELLEKRWSGLHSTGCFKGKYYNNGTPLHGNPSGIIEDSKGNKKVSLPDLKDWSNFIKDDINKWFSPTEANKYDTIAIFHSEKSIMEFYDKNTYYKNKTNFYSQGPIGGVSPGNLPPSFNYSIPSYTYDYDRWVENVELYHSMIMDEFKALGIDNVIFYEDETRRDMAACNGKTYEELWDRLLDLYDKTKKIDFNYQIVGYGDFIKYAADKNNVPKGLEFRIPDVARQFSEIREKCETNTGVCPIDDLKNSKNVLNLSSFNPLLAGFLSYLEKVEVNSWSTGLPGPGLGPNKIFAANSTYFAPPCLKKTDKGGEPYCDASDFQGGKREIAPTLLSEKYRISINDYDVIVNASKQTTGKSSDVTISKSLSLDLKQLKQWQYLGPFYSASGTFKATISGGSSLSLEMAAKYGDLPGEEDVCAYYTGGKSQGECTISKNGFVYLAVRTNNKVGKVSIKVDFTTRSQFNDVIAKVNDLRNVKTKDGTKVGMDWMRLTVTTDQDKLENLINELLLAEETAKLYNEYGISF